MVGRVCNYEKYENRKSVTSVTGEGDQVMLLWDKTARTWSAKWDATAD